jgi:ribonuclease HII
MTVADPTLLLERGLFRDGAALVIGCDEVGRGAIAGPVAVGVSAFLPDVAEMPAGLRDSKLLSEKRRDALYPEVLAWAPQSAVGLADNAEVDALGIVPGLGLAAVRGLEALVLAGVPVESAVVVLDGSHDWLTPALTEWPSSSRPRVMTRVKGDRDCATVAAASVLAKVHRDRLMIEADAVHPGYGWPRNKGYASAGHYEAISRLGATALHRWSWLKAPGLF